VPRQDKKKNALTQNAFRDRPGHPDRLFELPSTTLAGELEAIWQLFRMLYLLSN
jgi:hypothetical protein